MAASNFDSTLDYLRKICSVREYCTCDIREKASKRLEIPSEVDKAVACLQEEGYLSDERYAVAFARDKSSIAGWGAYKIRFHLSSKGIHPEIIARAIQEIDSVKSGEKLLSAVRRKYILLKDDRQVKIKLLKFALSRGYSYEEANKVVSEILYGKNEDLSQIDRGGDLCTGDAVMPLP